MITPATSTNKECGRWIPTPGGEEWHPVEFVACLFGLETVNLLALLDELLCDVKISCKLKTSAVY
jgi:hypothetical protein